VAEDVDLDVAPGEDLAEEQVAQPLPLQARGEGAGVRGVGEDEQDADRLVLGRDRDALAGVVLQERDADGDVALEEGERVAGSAGDFPGDAGEGGGEGIVGVVRDPDEQRARVEAPGEDAGDVRAEDLGAQEVAQLGELKRRGRGARHAPHLGPRLERRRPPRRRVAGEVDRVRGKVLAGLVGESQRDAPGARVRGDVEGEQHGLARVPAAYLCRSPGSANEPHGDPYRHAPASATAGLFATVGDQLLGEPPIGRDVSAHERLRSLHGIARPHELDRGARVVHDEDDLVPPA
jgi:hypothetical protein